MPLAAAIAAYPNGIDTTQRRLFASGIATISGVYPAGGYPINWSAMTQGGENGGGIYLLQQQAAAVPVPGTVVFQSQTGVNGYQYVYNYVAATLRIFLNGVEVTTGNTPAADVILFAAQFSRAL